MVDTALDAIEAALAGQPNSLRHRIDHNDILRPDQLSRFGEIGVIPLVRGRPNTCFINDIGNVHPFGEIAEPYYRIVRSLVEANPGLPIAWHSDTSANARQPMHDLYDLVTRRQIRSSDGSICMPPDWRAADVVNVAQALEMMTIHGAYALFMEKHLGSLRPGKFADLIILSKNPLEVDSDEITNIEVLMGMVNGNVEHCLEGSESLCP